MAKQATIEAAPERLPVERQKRIHNTANPVFQGICAAQGWRPGKMVTSEEYKAAERDFLAAPCGKGKAVK